MEVLEDVVKLREVDALNEQDRNSIHTLSIKTLNTCFKLNYCNTGHSKQGDTITGRLYIHDINSRTCPRWLYTAVTRCTRLKDVKLVVKMSNSDKQGILNRIRDKIASHKEEDIKKGRAFDETDYVSVRDVVRLIKKQNRQCGHCGDELLLEYEALDEQKLSINRLNNDLAHVKYNCEITCLNCNKKIK